MLPTLTLSGVDERVTQREIEQLLQYTPLELGLLYTATPENRPRYPELHQLLWVAEIATGRCAVHICGRGARAALLARELDDLLVHAARIQINGQLAPEDVAQACALYPEHTIITQHHPANAALLAVGAPNHALLVDASGGSGTTPALWERPSTATKPVGFAGGLGPANLRMHLPVIAAAAGEGPWWIDMEAGLRVDDWFSPRAAHAVIAAFDRFCAGGTGRLTALGSGAAIADYPGATYIQISEAVGAPVRTFAKDVRKMVERGLIVATEVDGVKYHTLGRAPLRDVTGTPEDRRKRKQASEQRYAARRNEARRAERAQRRANALAAIRRPSKPLPPPTVPSQTVDEFLANGGQIERLPVHCAAPARA